MEPITWSYKISDNLNPSENFKRLLKFISLDSLEFITTDGLTDAPGHVYSIHKISIIGDPTSVNIGMRETTDKINNWLLGYIESDEAFTTKVYELRSSVFLLNEFMIKHQPYGFYFTELKNVFTIISLKDQNKAEATIHQLNISEQNETEIRQHLSIRYNYCSVIKEFMLLALEKLHLTYEVLKNEKEKNLTSQNTTDESRERNLLELWLSLEKYGLLDFEDNHIKRAELRNKFMSIFNCKDENYKKHRSSLVNKKNRKADFLNVLVEIFEKGKFT